jgi:hypothetical protein
VRDNKQDWTWVTTEMFDDKLEKIVNGMGALAMLDIPGVREIVTEHLNNEVLEALADEAARDPETGEEIADEEG